MFPTLTFSLLHDKLWLNESENWTENATNGVKTIQINKIFMFCFWLLFHNHDSLYGVLMSLKHLLFQAQTFIISDRGVFFIPMDECLFLRMCSCSGEWFTQPKRTPANPNRCLYCALCVHLHHLNKPARHMVITVVKVLGKDAMHHTF